MRQLADFALIVTGVLAGLHLFSTARLWKCGGKLPQHLRTRLLMPLGITLIGIGQRLPDPYRVMGLICVLAGIVFVIAGLLNLPSFYAWARHRPTVGGVTAANQTTEIALPIAYLTRGAAENTEPRSIVLRGGQTPERNCREHNY